MNRWSGDNKPRAGGEALQRLEDLSVADSSDHLFWFCLLFSTPTIFSGYYCAFFGDPYIGMHDSPDQWYNDVQHTINNCSSLTILCWSLLLPLRHGLP
ncbi:hypothetical protein L596_030384 [Steinernema carpocapsae]|uniref:Uncharacterized protein n=1 Tax=Steinernema carpocapsae TaxID=34508 RepID=A0A4U5LP94_STECR|nr:hypothetical protein L596_030384 [Steinernema carpocapsae]